MSGTAREVHIRRPQLPVDVETLRVCSLPVGDTRVDLQFYRLGEEVGVVPHGHLEGGISVVTHL